MILEELRPKKFGFSANIPRLRNVTPLANETTRLALEVLGERLPPVCHKAHMVNHWSLVDQCTSS
ncbi:hypothetical protein A6X21_09575 [Planctopirus hydrillae]|uniref:Uncharacterized protein n=1 Tax=Planctopirus hydrillae TaxID=1841610 RepID=A0A1C3E7H2_9PLAN|nr:hypothetical protein A6X21_09575 [Planctopirus hydrillae]